MVPSVVGACTILNVVDVVLYMLRLRPCVKGVNCLVVNLNSLPVRGPPCYLRLVRRLNRVCSFLSAWKLVSLGRGADGAADDALALVALAAGAAARATAAFFDK